MPVGSEGKAQGLMAMSHQFVFFVGPPSVVFIIELDSLARDFLLYCFCRAWWDGALFMTGRAVVEIRCAIPVGFDYPGSCALPWINDPHHDAPGSKNRGDHGPLAARRCLVFAFVATLWGFVVREEDPEPMIDLSFSRSRFWLRLGCPVDVLHHSGAHDVRHAFLSPGRTKTLTTFMGIIFLVPSLLSMVLSPVSGAMTDVLVLRSLDPGVSS